MTALSLVDRRLYGGSFQGNHFTANDLLDSGYRLTLMTYKIPSDRDGGPSWYGPCVIAQGLDGAYAMLVIHVQVSDIHPDAELYIASGTENYIRHTIAAGVYRP